MTQLTEEQVEQLYESNPDLYSPAYPKKVIRVYDDENETIDVEIVVDNKKYLCTSSPVLGDTWYEL